VVGQRNKVTGVNEGSMCSITLWDLEIAGIMCLAVPSAYGLGCAVGVYFVGSRGKQTGSLLATLGGSLLGMFVMALLLFYIGAAEKYVVMLGREKIVLWPLAFIAAPSVATLGFNLTRRYEIQEKRTNIAKSGARITLIVLAVCSIVPIWMYRSDVGDIGFLIPIILFVLALVLK